MARLVGATVCEAVEVGSIPTHLILWDDIGTIILISVESGFVIVTNEIAKSYTSIK